ncbi:hypothetical protein ACFVTT_35395 [Streptomyces niveus]|uniref:hypothetical protein n=1 Tax=Streptomyces niveus TaxID=193462 RepID=UPI00342D96CC
MTAIPGAALAVLAAAYDDYRLITPPEQQTPAGAADYAAQYLLSSGYTIRPDLEPVRDAA